MENPIILRTELIRFFLWFRGNGEKYIDKTIESMIDIYISETITESDKEG